MKSKRKVETMEEYLARGGSITFCPSKKETDDGSIIRKKVTGPAVIMSLEEADLFYGEGKVKKKPSKPSNSIDINALPEVLRNKFISRLKDEGGYGESEEN